MLQKPATQNTSRVAWIDIAKGYGILAILYSHLCVGYTVSNWLFTFHIPLFFFLSGWVFRADREPLDFLKRKVKTLLLPYFALSVPLILFEGFMVVPPGETPLHWTAHLILAVLIQRRHWTIWYLACLFVLNLLFYAVVRKMVTPGRIGLASAVLSAVGFSYVYLGGPVLPWNADACLTALPFFAAGYLCHLAYPRMQQLLHGWRSVVLFFLLAAGNVLAGYPVITGAREGLNIFANTYGFLPLTYLSAFCGIGCVILFSHCFSVAPIRYLGRNSLLYFAWHQSLLMHLLFLFWQKLRVDVSLYPTTVILGIRLLELLAMVLVLTVCNEILSRSRLKWVLGR